MKTYVIKQKVRGKWIIMDDSLSYNEAQAMLRKYRSKPENKDRQSCFIKVSEID